MVLYFSATGNTKLIAKKIAERLRDESLDLLQRIKNSDYSDIYSERPFVICSPIYVSELPGVYADYLRNVVLTGSGEVYGVFTNGGFSGIAGGQLKRIVKRKGMLFKGYAEFKMASNHITNKSHKPLDDAEIRKRIKASVLKVEELADVIQNGSTYHNRHIFLLEYLITLPIAPVLCYINQTTKQFRIKDTCISCGKCVKLCPMHVIEMQSGKPVWKEKRCAHCMSCIQNCPAEAIEFGEVTEGRKRYNASKVNL